MSQTLVKVQYVHKNGLWELPCVDYIPVVELSALWEMVEYVQKLAKQDHTGPVDPFGDLSRIEDVTQRLLASLGAPTAPTTKGKSHE